MSLPAFPGQEGTPTREQAINQIMYSIAMEELGLSHVINAEGEKLQYALGTIPGMAASDEPLTTEELLKINDSIQKTLESALMNQFILKEKLVRVLSADSTIGPPGPPGPPGQPEPFLSSYIEALADSQHINPGGLVVFDLDSVDSVGNNISINPAGTIFTITRTGLYHVEWNLSISSAIINGVVVGIYENGEPASGAATLYPGAFSSGTLIEVDTVPFTISLINYRDPIDIASVTGLEDTAASIRIVRFADGPSE